MKLYERGSPWVVERRPGAAVCICRCGQTGNPPYCDGSHGEFPGCTPDLLEVAADGQLWLCGCGKSSRLPLCDGTHKRRPGGGA